MKKVLLLFFSLVIAYTLVACGSKDNDRSNANGDEPISNNSSKEQADTTDGSNQNNSQDSAQANENGDEAMKVKLTINNEEVIVNMYDNPTSRDFVGRLPLTLTFEDDSGIEKISYLEEKLSTEDAPSGSDPLTGDFAYYAPWGNVIFYYNDFGYSNGLIQLGKIESGTEEFAEKLASMGDDFTVTIERME